MMPTEFDADDGNLMKRFREYADEDKAREFLESLRWPAGVKCPHCQFDAAYKLTPKAGSRRPARQGVYCCAACRRQFTVTVKTVFEGSHIKISSWLTALFSICSSKKNVSARRLHRLLKITCKSAGFMARRIRLALDDKTDDGTKLSGVVAADEPHVRGKGKITANGLGFEEALRKMLVAPPPPSSKSAKRLRQKK
jgi:transposase-like protein